ncbi:sodium:proton antiporter [Epidermidibacterium keratini]|uniref:Sodium:proton antiporter n=1 Tax=Epidermidibacterium keratini TaxID=1891644 RepID=A0A7L4YM40_9ACTN|nr:cation:proton antiporter [Epidermidibacterium keratini]QHB99893.1 sodium:proton antiporter [Epidermidibacterium keratini]
MTSDAFYLIIGLALLIAMVLPTLLHRLPLSPPIILVLIGVVLGVLPISNGIPALPSQHPEVTEHLTEMTVLIALMGVGLAIDRGLSLRRPKSWRTWSSAWRLLGIAMPLSIAGVALLGWVGLGVGPAAALLLGAALAPTDPVLASDVQVEGPTVEAEDQEVDEDDEVRFALTSEAGLNDGLAFPFVYAAIFLATIGPVSEWGISWLTWDLVGKVVIGAAIGVLSGWLLGKVSFRGPHQSLRVAETGEPLMAVAAVLLSYGVAEVVGGYGFLAVFCTALTIRAAERTSQYHETMHGVVERLERLLTLLVLLFLGFALGNGLLDAVDWRSVVIAVGIVFVIRPLSGLIAFVGTGRLNWRERLVVSSFGVRGVGSIYYLAYATNQADFGEESWLWGTVGLTITLSVLVHGISATPVMNWLDSHREGPDRSDETRFRERTQGATQSG